MSDKDERIRMRAYYIWERQGGGRAEDHWGEAEREVERELAQQAAQAIGSQDQAKPRTGKRGSAPARVAGARANASEQIKSKPVARRGKRPSNTRPDRPGAS
jgi:hypothetical protein